MAHDTEFHTLPSSSVGRLGAKTAPAQQHPDIGLLHPGHKQPSRAGVPEYVRVQALDASLLAAAADHEVERILRQRLARA